MFFCAFVFNSFGSRRRSSRISRSVDTTGGTEFNGCRLSRINRREVPHSVGRWRRPFVRRQVCHRHHRTHVRQSAPPRPAAEQHGPLGMDCWEGARWLLLRQRRLLRHLRGGFRPRGLVVRIGCFRRCRLACCLGPVCRFGRGDRTRVGQAADLGVSGDVHADRGWRSATAMPMSRQVLARSSPP